MGVKSGGQETTSAYLADMEHGRGAKLKYPLGLAPSEAYTYLEKRDEFNIMSILKSPMTLLALFSMVAMFIGMKAQPMVEEEKKRAAQAAADTAAKGSSGSRERLHED